MPAETKKIIWLASYPKSGNTWLRAFLANYLMADAPDAGPVALEAMRQMSFSDASAKAISEIAGRDHRELGTKALFAARERYLERFATGPKPAFVKTHCANASVEGFEQIPLRFTRTAIYLVRDPRDVVLSYADHMGRTVEEAAAMMADPKNRLGGTERQSVQFLGSWSQHVQSWLGAEGIGTLVLRYEDLLARPEKGFAAVVRAIGAPLDAGRLARAIEAASFGSLAGMEAAQGFSERTERQERFFRTGTSGQWKAALPAPVAERIAAEHGPVMRFLRYL